MKLITSAAKAKANSRFGSQPIVVLKIEWPSGTSYYADSDYTFGANSCAGKILAMGDAASVSKALSIGELSTISVTLDDNDLSIKSKINTDLIEGTYCTVYFHFNGLAEADAVTLLRGRIQGDIGWDQATRQLSFTIDANTLVDQEVGFSTTRATLPTMSTEAEGKAWPLCFGTVLKVPALNLYKPKMSQLSAQFLGTDSSIKIADGASWPQGVDTDIDIDYIWHIRCRGQFNGNVFTFSQKNISKFTNVTCASRVTDGDEGNSSVFWITDSTQNLVGNYVYMTVGATKYVNYVESQYGAKCYCGKEWRADNSDTNLLINNTHMILDVRGAPDASWGAVYNAQYKAAGPDGVPHWYTGATVIPDSYILPAGADVTEVVGNPYTYIANLIPSTQILGVYAYRTYAGEKTLQPVPSSYYTKNLSNTIAGKNCTTITFTSLLSSRKIEKWEDEVYVSLVSSVGSNTTDQIKHILQTYSTVSIDLTTFNAVATLINNYPSNFALLDTKSVVSVIEDICYQARLAILITSNIAYLDYISRAPTPDLLMTEDLIALKTLNLGFTKTEDLVTKYVAKWKPDYTTDREYTYKNNQNILGTKVEEKDFYIYNIESLVKLSARYWGWRLSNSWRTAAYSAFLPALGLEVFDTIENRISTLSSNPIRGQVTGVQHNTDEQVIKLEMTLASLSGQSSSGEPTESVTFYTGDPTFPITGSEPMPGDPGAGLSEVDYKVPVDSTNNPQNKETKRTVDIQFDTDTFQRGVSETVTFTLVDESGNWIGQDVKALVTIASDDSADVISPTTITMTGGRFVGPITISGGAGIDNAVIKAQISNTNYTGISKGFKIQDEGEIQWTSQPFSAVRGKTFSVSLTGGAVSAVYSVSVSQGDSTDKLYSGSTQVTTITTDASGNFSATDWKFDDGDYVIDDKVIVLTRSGNTFPSEPITLIDNPASPGIVYKITGSWTLGQVLMNNGSGGWILGDPSTAAGKTLGVIARVVGGDQYLVVRGLCCLSSILDHTTYNLGASGTLSTSAGFFVMRSYQGQLCWVGGAGTVNKLDDIGDVDVPSAANGNALVYDTSANKWVNAAITDPDAIIGYTYSSGSAQLNIGANKITYAKMQQVTATSILCNPTGALANVQALQATTDDTVLTRSGGVLVWQPIASAAIGTNAVTYAKIQQMPGDSVLGNPAATTGNVSAIQATGNGQFLSMHSGVLAFAAIAYSDLPTAGAFAGTYGSADWQPPTFTVNNQGIITAVGTKALPAIGNDTTAAGPLRFVGNTLTLSSGSAVFNANKLNGIPISGTPSTKYEWLKSDGAGNWIPYTMPSAPGAAQLGFLTAHDSTAASGYRDLDCGAAYGIVANPTGSRAFPVSVTALTGTVLCRKSTGNLGFQPALELGNSGTNGGSLKIYAASGTVITIDSVGIDMLYSTTAQIRTFDSGRLYISSSGSNIIDLNLSDIIGINKNIKLREIDVCDGGAAKKMLVLCSAAY